jgi:hypothetical protein
MHYRCGHNCGDAGGAETQAKAGVQSKDLRIWRVDSEKGDRHSQARVT